MAVYPIPAGRSSDALLTQRLLSQLQTGQKRLLQVEQQLGTGRSIQLPSEDPSAAARAVTLQRLLEGKVQLKTNLDTSQSYLSATDTALGGVADLLANARGLALGAADSTTSDLERRAMAMEIESTISQMLVVGNQSFRGRYLFAGTESTQLPFESQDNFIAYLGNDVTFRTLADPDLLFETNIPGQELFGGVSSEVRGIDLNPIIHAGTRLTDLYGGQGITEGSIVISDGTHTSTVSLVGARTLGDVVRMIEDNPPAGRDVRATIGTTGLIIDMNDGGGGSLIIRDLQGGTTAAELGITRSVGSASEPIIGSDLDPILRRTTALDDLMGARALVAAHSAGPNNDVILEARDRGEEGNGYSLQFVDDNLRQAAPGLTAGSEYAELSTTPRAAIASLQLSGADNDLVLTATSAGRQWNNVKIDIDASQNLGNAAQVTFDSATNTLRIAIDDTNQTSVGAMVGAINASGYFSATADPSAGEGYNPAAQVLSADAGIRGDTGNSGGDANTIYVVTEAGVSTANQVIDALLANPQIDALFDARLDPQDSTTTALAGSRPVDVNAGGITIGGSGVEWDQSSGLQITNGGETYVIDLQSAETVEDMLNILNASDAMLLAEINRDQTGINIRSRLSGADLSIGENGGTTATDMGLRTFNRDTSLAELNYRQGVNAVPGPDFTIRRNDGVELEIDISSANSIGDVLDLINNHPDNLDPNTAVVARLQAFGNGIELVDDNPSAGESLTVSRVVGSNTAWELGLVAWGENSSQPATPASAEAQIAFAPPNDVNTAFRVLAANAGTGFNDVDIELRSTLSGDVATATFDPVGRRLIIDMADGQTTTNTVLSAIAAEGTFTAQLDLASDPTNDGTGTFIAPPGVAATTAGGTAETLAGRDTNPIETEGVFNSLLRLRDAIENNEVEDLSRIVEMLDADFDRLNFGRAAVGARAQGLDAIEMRNGDDQIELRSSLSNEIDIDLAEAATQFAARQAAYEASLRTIGNMYRLSLLDYL